MIENLASYELVHFLPFSRDAYFRMFETHNETIWPAQIVCLGLAVALGHATWTGRGRRVAALLAPAWMFVGWAFFVARYETLLWAAPYIGAGFAVQGLLLAGWAALDRVEMSPGWTTSKLAGVAIAAVGLFAVPLLAPLSGRSWSAVELFGATPAPTVLVTAGLLLVCVRTPWPLMIVPVLWSIIAAATAIALDYPEGVVVPLLVALVAFVAIFLGLRRRRAAEV